MMAYSANARFQQMGNKIPWVHTVMKYAAQIYDTVT